MKIDSTFFLLLTIALYNFFEFYYIYPHCVLNVQVHQLPQHLPALTSSKPLAKLSQTRLDQLSNNHKPQPAKATGSASRFVASRTAATLVVMRGLRLVMLHVVPGIWGMCWVLRVMNHWNLGRATHLHMFCMIDMTWHITIASLFSKHSQLWGHCCIISFWHHVQVVIQISRGYSLLSY